MDRIRKHSDRASTRRVVDGILNAPANRGRNIQNAPRNPHRPVFHERVKAAGSATQTRPIGDFSQAEGYHSADHSQIGRVHNASEATPAGQDEYIRKQFDASGSARKTKSHGRLFKKRSKNDRQQARQKRSGRRKLFIRGTATIVLAGLLLVGYLGATGYFNLNKIFKGGGAAVAMKANVDPTKLKGEGDGRVNVLLLGRGGEGHDGADLTDTIMVASIDPINNKAALVSIPRDLWVKGKFNESKINAVFAYAKNAAISDGKTAEEAEQQGIQSIETTVENITGLNIHYYGMVDFEAFEKAVNTVGGVTINVPEELRDSTMAWQNNWNPVLAPKGLQTMDGRKALMYVRSRHGSARGDFDRAERQRLFLMALKSQILSVGTFSNPMKVSRLMNDFGNHAKTDFSLNDLMRLYKLSGNISSFESIGFVDAPHNFLTTDFYNGQSIVRPIAGTFAYDQIKDYLRTALPDGYIVKENAPIIVLNGSLMDGMATKKSDELKSYGYNVVKADTAPTQDYDDTVIVNLGGDNKYTQNYLEKRFGVKATTKLPAGITLPEGTKSGFVIIIGQNESNR